MLISVGVLFGGIFIIKQFIFLKNKKAIKVTLSQVVTISATAAKKSSWSPQLNVTGSLRTVKGVNVTTQLAGMIEKIYFQPGAYVREGELLVTLNTKPNVAKLHELEANAKYAKITYFRDKKQYAFGAISHEKLGFHSIYLTTYLKPEDDDLIRNLLLNSSE